VDLPSGHALVTALVTGVLLGGLFAITALGLSLVFGVMRLINLVHGELVVLGAYLSYVLLDRAGIDPLAGMLVVAPALAVVCYPVQRVLLTPLMSKGPEAPLLTTFGLSVIAQNVFILVFTGDTQSLNTSYSSDSVELLSIDIPVVYLIGFGLALTLSVAAHLVIQRTGIGREIRASAEDAEAAEVLGVNVPRIHAITYALGAACAAVGGVLVGLTFSFTPTSGVTYLLTGFAVVVLGGLGSVKGTLLGGLLLGAIESVGGAFFGDGYRDLIGMLAFLTILALRPQGLFGRRRA
jgi:branched-chain amino acid transport system permease protein